MGYVIIELPSRITRRYELTDSEQIESLLKALDKNGARLKDDPEHFLTAEDIHRHQSRQGREERERFRSLGNRQSRTRPMTYRVELKRSVQKALARLPKNIQRRIAQAIDGLTTEPRPHGYIQMETDDILYRIRVGDYRIVYEIIDDRLVVLVIRIAHRREVYR